MPDMWINNCKNRSFYSSTNQFHYIFCISFVTSYDSSGAINKCLVEIFKWVSFNQKDPLSRGPVAHSSEVRSLANVRSEVASWNARGRSPLSGVLRAASRRRMWGRETPWVWESTRRIVEVGTRRHRRHRCGCRITRVDASGAGLLRPPFRCFPPLPPLRPSTPSRRGSTAPTASRSGPSSCEAAGRHSACTSRGYLREVVSFLVWTDHMGHVPIIISRCLSRRKEWNLDRRKPLIINAPARIVYEDRDGEWWREVHG